MTTISICMIVLNEENLLPRCLANWRELADELIVVDTGSTDRTVEIAEQHGATVLHYDWIPPGHKGAARMVGIDAASGDWIVVVDADEIIDDPTGIRDFLHSETGQQYDIINVRFQNYAEDGTPCLDWFQPRIFRRGKAEYYTREHELPLPTNGQPLNAGTLNALFRHRPPPDRAAPKVGPMLERLELDVQEHPSDLHPLYFLARQYVIAGMWEKGIEANKCYIERAKECLPARMMTPDAYQHLSIAYECSGQTDLALEAQFAAISYEPHRRSFWVRLASMTRHFLGDHMLAMAYMHVAMMVGPKGREASETDDHKLLAMMNHSLTELYRSK